MFGELIFHALLFVLMMFLFITSFSFPILNIGGKLGAAWWPQVVLTLGMVLLLVSAILLIRKGRAAFDEKERIEKKEIISLATSSLIFIVALLSIRTIGFLVSAWIIVLGFMIQLGARKVWVIAVSSVVIALIFTLLFGRFMMVSLPRGMGIFRAISYYIY